MLVILSQTAPINLLPATLVADPILRIAAGSGVWLVFPGLEGVERGEGKLTLLPIRKLALIVDQTSVCSLFLLLTNAPYFLIHHSEGTTLLDLMYPSHLVD